MLDTVLEYTVIVFNLLYLILISRKRIAGWFFGILASGIMMYTFLKIHLNAEAFLMLFYIVAGFYGWYSWHKRQPGGSEEKNIQIIEWSLIKHLLFIITCCGLSLLIFLIIQQIPSSEMPLIDSFTTGFAILVTFMVAIKELHNWLYWISKAVKIIFKSRWR